MNAILFPAFESAPRLVKATFKVKDYEGKIWHSFVVGQFDIERREMGYLQVSNYPKGPMLPLEHQMTLFWRDCFSFDGSSLNRCIRNLTGGVAPQGSLRPNGNEPHPWKGNILAIKSNMQTEKVSDASWKDLPAIVKYFRNY